MTDLDVQFISGRVVTGLDTVHGIVGVCLRCRWTTTMALIAPAGETEDQMGMYLDQLEQHQHDGCGNERARANQQGAS